VIEGSSIVESLLSTIPHSGQPEGLLYLADEGFRRAVFEMKQRSWMNVELRRTI
jgi:hypothetical protein